MRALRRRFFLSSPKPGLASQVSEGANGYKIDRNSQSSWGRKGRASTLKLEPGTY
jgi:hypothetical protein